MVAILGVELCSESGLLVIELCDGRKCFGQEDLDFVHRDVKTQKLGNNFHVVDCRDGRVRSVSFDGISSGLVASHGENGGGVEDDATHLMKRPHAQR